MSISFEPSVAALVLAAAPDWWGAFGRLHPLVLHVPIGLLTGVAALELWTALVAKSKDRSALTLLAWMAAASAALTAWTGETLAEEPGRAGELLERHGELGNWVAWSSIAMAIAHALSRGGTRAVWLWVYRAALALTLVQLTRAGHLGASMTHGEDFLFEPLRGGAEHLEPGEELTSSDPSYARDIAPLFAAKCTSCHGPSKKKGGLALHTPAAIAKGGRDGPAFVAGDPAASEMVRRLHLPVDDEDHMPPEGKPQPGPAEIAAIEAWIRAGATFATGAAEAAPDPIGPDSTGSSGPSDPTSAEPTETGAVIPPTRPDPAPAIAALRQSFVHVQALSEGSELLWIDFTAPAADIDDAAAGALLEPVRELVADLGLARSRVTDAIAPLLARMPELRRLDLAGTACGDLTVAALAGHARLEELVLTGTRITDASADALLALPALRRVYAWSTGLGPDAVARTRAARPELAIDLGDAAGAAVLEDEGEVVVAKAPMKEGEAADGAGEPAASGPGEPATSASRPINATCPVSGAPVKAQFSIEFEGRVIGFCCPNCPKEFQANPGAFRTKLP